MKGIQFVVDDKGKKTAVLIDLKEWGDLLADFFDIAVSRHRRKEPAISWEELKGP